MIDDTLVVSVVLFITVVVFLTGKLPYEITAFTAVIVLVLLGQLTPTEVLSGFASAAVVTLVCMFVVAGALGTTGVARKLAGYLSSVVGRSETQAIVGIMCAAVLFSSCINNVAVVALFLPSIRHFSHASGIPTARLYLPLAFGSVLGGMCTLLGTSPNLIASDVLVRAGHEPLGFFDFLPFGIAASLAGIIAMVLVGRNWLPSTSEHSPESELSDLYAIEDWIHSFEVSEEATIAGRTLRSSGIGERLSARVVAIDRDGRRTLAPTPEQAILAGDLLYVRGRSEELERKAALEGLRIRKDIKLESLGSLGVGVQEILLAPRSDLIGQTLREARFRDHFGVQVLSIWREGIPLRTKIGGQPLQFGDALLVQGTRENIARLNTEPDFVVVGESVGQVQRPNKAWAAIVGLVLVFVLAAFGLQEPHIAAMIGALFVIITGAITVEETYREVNWGVALLVAALLALGIAVDHSGIAVSYTRGLIDLVAPFGSWACIVALLVVASLFSQLLDSPIAVVLLAPAVIPLAAQLGLSPSLSVLIIALGSSMAFMTPFSHKAILLVAGVGGYQTKDFVTVGTLVTVVVAMALSGVAILYL